MLHHDNYYIFFVNLRALVEFHCKVKCTNCILYVKCISIMAESDKTLIDDGNLSNNNRKNSAPNIVPHTSGTVHPDTHPTHHAAVSEPSTLKRKQTSFQITSVTVKGSRLSTDGGEDSADDLDESHTEDASSDILDCSRTTDVDNDQLSEDTNNTNNDETSSHAPSIPVKCKKELPVKQDKQNDNVAKFPSEASKIVKSNLPCENTQTDCVKPPALPDQWQHRFRVVKIVRSEPFKRGRWVCMDFMDPPAPVTEAKVEIVETAVSANVQLIGSLSDNIPADKIAHIYEISPSEMSDSVSVAAGSDRNQQPMYGIFLPLNNGQYPLITGMHSRVLQPLEREVKPQESAQSIASGDRTLHQQHSTSKLSQPQNVSPQQSQNIAASLPQSQSTTAYVQQSQNISTNLQQSQNVACNTQQTQNVMQQPPCSSASRQQSQNVTMNMHQAQNVSTSMQQVQNVAGMQQSQNISTNIQQSQNVTTNLQQMGNLQHSHVPASMQQSQNTTSNLQQQQQNIAPNLQQQQQNIAPNLQQQQQNIAPNLQQNIVSNLQQQNIASNLQQQQPNIVSNLQQQNVPSAMQQQSIPSTHYSTQNAAPSSINENQQPISCQTTQGMQGIPSQNPQLPLQTPASVHTLPQSQNITKDPGSVTVQQVAVGDSNVKNLPNYPAVHSQSQMTPESQSLMQQNVQKQTVTVTPPQSISETSIKAPNEISSTPQIGEVSVNQSVSKQSQIPVVSVAQTSIPATQVSSSANIPEVSPISIKNPEAVVPSQIIQNHIEAKEVRTPPSTNLQVSQEVLAEIPAVKNDINGEESESVPSGTSTVAIDNKIEQAMDLVKSHLMFAVREEVDVLKEKITELMERISQLEYENNYLRANATQQTLEQLNQSQLLQQQQQNQPSTVSMNSLPQVSQQTTQQHQMNIQNQQPTS
ncbi:protein bunched, class 2/F/G isoform-like [Argiope bruennichi]|uniref:protein bunched, class 2/F/G isoform-like n=1 Tax=Argiope bruennichi TaxID=94029 RepID=UPI0024941952|nr:protein bunched, class 2/F/G isoform-like [Argiope bruennichi]